MPHDLDISLTLTGGLTAAAGGIAAAILFGYLAALIFKPGDKS